MPKWNEAAVIKCDRTLDEEKDSYKLPIEHKTAFSANKPLLLGSFTCGKVYRTPHTDMLADLSVDVKIIETTDWLDANANAECLSKFRAQLQSKETEVLLPYSVLIRPKFHYTISIENIPDGHGFYSKGMKTEIWIESDVKIEMCNANKFISALNFNRI